MSRDVIELVRSMDSGNIEFQMALQCAPVIAGLKISNLLIISADNELLFHEILEKTEISAYRLLFYKGKVVYILFRKEQLESFLAIEEVRRVFTGEGYTSFSTESILKCFRDRYTAYRTAGADFPHEMGLLLGYPVEDVIGFMKNDGSNYLYSGYWKVYEKPDEKRKLFKQFEYAREELLRMLAKGISIREITAMC